RRLAQASAASCRRVVSPALYDARANSKAEEPAIRVRSRSKKAAPRTAAAPSEPETGPASPALPASQLRSSLLERPLRWSATSHVDHDGVPLPAAGADRRAALPAPAPAQLQHQAAEDARAGGADGMPDGHGAAVHVHL